MYTFRCLQNTATSIIHIMYSVFHWFLIFSTGAVTMFTSGILEKKQHQTNASLEKMNDLTCFNCNSLFDKNCENVTNMNKQNTSISKLYSKCKGDKRTCMVKRYSYSMSSENSTTKIKMWSLERNCTNKCEKGCIVIGERTKLYACTTCCNTNYCNVGNDAASLCEWFKFVYYLCFTIIIIMSDLLGSPLIWLD